MALRLPALVAALLLALSLLLPAQVQAQQGASSAAALQVYVYEGCPHCAKAREFLERLAAEQPDVRIVYRDVHADASASEELARRSQAAGVWPPGVPTFIYGDSVLVGYEDEAHTGARLRALLAQQPLAADEVPTTLFGTLSASRLGLPLFTLVLGLLDGFNPCATWVLLFLLSLLVRMQDRRRMALVAGTFVLASGAVYYAFMAAWLNVFLVLGMSDALRVTLALLALLIGALNVKDSVALHRGPTLSIPESAKPGLYQRVRAIITAPSLRLALMGATALAVVVNFVELLCTAGFPAVYTAVLAQHTLDPATHYAYLGLYILGYLADDSLMVAVAVAALGQRKLSERGGRWLKLLSGTVMLGLGATLLLRPGWLM
jgi:glutaredoxin